VSARADHRRAVLSDHLDELRAMPPGWDSYGAYQISHDALEVAETIFDLTQVTPMADGGVKIEWHFGGMTMEVEIRPDGTFGPWLCAGADDS
jgi:hypothetical protein